MLEDDADNHEFKVSVPRDFAQKIGAYLETWDESYEAPGSQLRFLSRTTGSKSWTWKIFA